MELCFGLGVLLIYIYISVQSKHEKKYESLENMDKCFARRP